MSVPLSMWILPCFLTVGESARMASSSRSLLLRDEVSDTLHIMDSSNAETASLTSLSNNDPFYTETYNSTSFNDSSDAHETDDVGCYSGQNLVGNLITTILYSLVCVVGLSGNTLVIYVVLRFTKMQTVTNIYILNLAIADECFLIGIPFLLYTMRIGSWRFGEYACKAYMVSTSITQFTSSIFLLIMSADRYVAVCHPITSPQYRTPRVSKCISSAAWLASAVLMLPVILFASTVQYGEHTSCNIKWPEGHNTQSGTTFILYTLVLGFATPLTFILSFYYLVIRRLRTVGPKPKSKEKKRSRRKVTRLVLTVITVYILCWLPYWISQVALIASTSSRCASQLEITVFLLVGCLGYSNSAMNPLLYAFLSDNFKQSFLKACTCVAGKIINDNLQFENSSTLPRLGAGGCGGKKRHTSVRLLKRKSKSKKLVERSSVASNSLIRTTTSNVAATTSVEMSTNVYPEVRLTEEFATYKTHSLGSNATLVVVTTTHGSPKAAEARTERNSKESGTLSVLHTDL